MPDNMPNLAINTSPDSAEDDPIRRYDPELQEVWRRDLKLPFRAVRPVYGEVQEMLVEKDWKPKIFLRENKKSSDIVIRFNCSSRKLAPELRKMYFEGERALPEIFEEVVSRAIKADRNSFGGELFNIAYRAYCATWIDLFEDLYVRQCHPKLNQVWLKDFRSKLKKMGGRRNRHDVKKLIRRFRFFEKRCKQLHALVEEVIHEQAQKGTSHDKMRLDIRRSLRKKIEAIPHGVNILGGEAFLNIPYVRNDRPVKLEAPKTWTPRQLAISLTMIEFNLRYQTVEKKLAHLKSTE